MKGNHSRISCRYLFTGGRRDSFRHVRRDDPHTFEQVVAYTESISHDGQSRVYGRTGWEKAGVHHVQVVQVMCFAVDVEGGTLGVMPKTYCAVLVRYASQGNPLAGVQVARK